MIGQRFAVMMQISDLVALHATFALSPESSILPSSRMAAFVLDKARDAGTEGEYNLGLVP